MEEVAEAVEVEEEVAEVVKVVEVAEEEVPRTQTSSFKHQEEEEAKHQEPCRPYSWGIELRQKYSWRQSEAIFASMPEPPR